MIDNIRDFIEDCFANAPKTQKVSDLKEELFANLSDKYNDLIASGMAPEKAFRRVVDGMGNIDELIRSLSETAPEYVRRLNEQRKKTALVVTCSIAIYIFALILGVFLVMVAMLNTVLSAIIFLAMCTVPSIWLLYYFLSRPKLLPPNMDVSQLVGYATKKGETLDSHSIRTTGTVMGIFVPSIVIVFFILGFLFHAWAWSWLVFLLIPIVAVLVSSINRRL